MKDLYRDFNINGSSTREVKIPAGYKFVTILNNTGYLVVLYRENIEDLSHMITSFPTYANLTIPLPDAGQERVIEVKYTGAGAAKFTLIFSEQNLGINQILSTASGFAIQADNVGLAKSLQLPAALTAGGNFKIALEEIIAAINVNPVDLDGYVWAKITFGAAEEQTVKASAGKVSAYVCEGAIKAKINDGAGNQAWILEAAERFGSNPLQCDTDIRLASDGAGVAWILYK